TRRGCTPSLNPLRPELLARRCRRLNWADEGELAKDKDVLCRRWLLVDVDPVRAPHVSATDAEKRAAWETAYAAREWLREKGWPARPRLRPLPRHRRLQGRRPTANTPRGCSWTGG